MTRQHGASNSANNLHSQKRSELVFRTRRDCWVIPCQCELVKLLIQHQKLDANALCFDSGSQCREFIRQLFLLALEDEVRTFQPSSIAEFARSTLKLNSRTLNIQ
ncbi:hypothetical protein [Arenicella xantha]|uniref:hypothetical protein n=1 Tax=Arenicella xantha TaxID=644221 RepID=UPI0011BFC641|nr:hypothetical protein [Arenicella xantha]